MPVEIKVPTLGESVTEATIAQWFKKAGDSVAADEAIAELETDKVTVEVYAPAAGKLASIAVQEGETVEVGALIATVEEGESGDSKPAPKSSAENQPAKAKEDAAKDEQDNQSAKQDDKQPSSKDESKGGVMPAARKVAADKGIDTAALEGTGKDGRVTKGDVLAADKAAEKATDKEDTSKAAANGGVSSGPYPYLTPEGPREERVKMTRLRKRIAERLKEAQNTAAMLTTFNEVDMTAVMALRKTYKDSFEKRHGVKLGFMGFFAKAAIMALQEIPAVNAEIDGDELVYKNYYDIGVAVGTDAGLVVPVVRDADKLSLAGIEKGIADLAVKARSGKLQISDMTGGTFTITNGGVYGSLMSTPILNAPQSGILGLHKIQQRPMVIDGKVEVRPMMYVALSYDHRIIDGKEAVTFLVRLKEAMEDPQRMLLAV